jgi:predicted nucleotidyltransferase
MARLRRLGVEHLCLFGSTARGDAGADSDVDLFFDYERGALGLFQLTDVRERASAILGRGADATTREGLRRALRRRFEAASVLVL